MAIRLNLGSFGVSASNYTVRWRVLGSTTWITSGLTPANPIPTTNLTPVITVPNENTIYEVQVITNCGTSTAQSAIIKKIARQCPTTLQYNVTTTDTTITISYPLDTPAPISNHVTSILVQLYQGPTLITSQTISSPNSNNTITFNGLNQNTTYTVRHTVTYAHADSIPEGSYPNGATANTSICTVSVQTEVTASCPIPVILSVQEV